MIGLILILCFLPACAVAGAAQNHEQEREAAIYEGPLAVVPPQAERDLTRRASVVTRSSSDAAPLYAQPNAQSAVLMTYYSGAPVEVIRSVGGFFLVQAGGAQAGLMGYMRAEDLAVGDAARRQVQPCFMRLEFNREAPVYAYCDEGAQQIGVCEVGKTYYAMSKNEDKWVQLFLPPQPHVWEEEDRLTKGFVKLETGMARGYWQELEGWEVEPIEGEITAEQAEALAMEYLDGSGNGGMPDVYTDARMLEKIGKRAYLRLHGSDPSRLIWWVYVWEEEGRDAANVMIIADQYGVTDMSQTYISEDEWGAYSVVPTL